MKIGESYIQYSKIFTAAVGLGYAIQVVATMIMICLFPEVAEYLLEVLSTTTSLFGLVFGCYTSNSVLEKFSTAKKTVDKALENSTPPTVG